MVSGDLPAADDEAGQHAINGEAGPVADTAPAETQPSGTRNSGAQHPRYGVPKAQRAPRPKKPKAENRLVPVVRQWLADVLPTLDRLDGRDGRDGRDRLDDLVAQAPKRWVIYEPMVLLPTGSFGFTCVPGQASVTPSSTTASLSWQAVLASASDEQKNVLWRGILSALSPTSGSSAELTHLAVNEGIPLHVAGAETEDENENENMLRSPVGLRPLYGDFGPAATTASGRDDAPSDDDLAAAFWVSTKQNGIYQTWAPRWSMFSRGNIKEKARLLAWPGENVLPVTATAVDLYAGIGYFVFSYARRGLRVLGWELNPWSTEALRRGALRNGWSVRIVRGAALAESTSSVVYGDGDGNGDGAPSIVIFVEDNQNAARRLAELRDSRLGQRLRVTHVNGGLLPTSRPMWRTAWDAVVDSGRDARAEADTNQKQPAFVGWLHLHDNVGVDELDSRKAEIQALVDAWGAAVADDDGLTVVSTAEHVELVKTFAPGVWHCVFDVRVAVQLARAASS